MNSLAKMSADRIKPSVILDRNVVDYSKIDQALENLKTIRKLLRSTSKDLDKHIDSWTIRTLNDLISDMNCVSEQLRKTKKAAVERGLIAPATYFVVLAGVLL